MQPRNIARVALVLNGTLQSAPHLMAVLQQADYVIAVDGGANWLLSQGLEPNLLIGDLDSVAPQTLEHLRARGCEVRQYSPHKDETDAELALMAAAAMAPQEIAVLGALGGRLDHTLANLLLLTMPILRGIAVRLYDSTSVIWLAEGESEIHGAPGDIVSLIPWGGDAHGIVTEGLAYPLKGESLRVGPSRGVSNVLVEERGRVSIQEGRLLIIHTPLAFSEEHHG